MCYIGYSGGEGLKGHASWPSGKESALPIKYDKLFQLLRGKGWSTYRIRKEKLISQASLQKMRKGEGHIDTRTIERLCQVLDCQPGDIMEYVDDPTGGEATHE